MLSVKAFRRPPGGVARALRTGAVASSESLCPPQGLYRQLGLELNYGGVIANTRDSHRLLAWARRHGEAAQLALAEELFCDYFTRVRFLAAHMLAVGVT